MKAFFAAARTVPALAGLAVALLLGVVVWLFVPALGVGAWWALLPLSLLPLLAWIGVIAWRVRRARRRDAALVDGSTEVDPKEARQRAAAETAREEEAAVATRLAGALRALQAAGGGRGGWLYERPWYVIIGPPGAGKTTALRASGLQFPLAEGKLPGVGGTRDCDWWISEQAVLIDTAGRYTTQDSDSAGDKAGWERFLDLLRRERPRQPLNGVIVAFGVDQLSGLDAAGRERHAQAVRRRVRELEQRLGQRLPIYLLVSKADLMAGFTEFFDDLDRDAREQVWGLTFAPETGPEGPLTAFRPEFVALLQRLQDRLLARLQAERGSAQRAAIAGFPAQFASIEAPLAAFVQAAFGGSTLDPAPFLRGVYFTSGTQEGSPIDRLTGVLTRSFGLQLRRAAQQPGQKGRAYFLGRLLRDLVFNEARLAVLDRAAVRRHRWLQVATLSLCAVLLVGGVAWGAWALRLESQRGARVEAAVTGAEQAATALGQARPLDRVAAGDDLLRLLPYLDRARELSPAAAGGAGGLGFGQRQKLTSAGDVAYEHALERVLLPRLLVRLEGQIRNWMQQPATLYLATRVYLMLGREGPLDRGLVQEWMAADWAQSYPGAAQTPQREALFRHLTTLLERDYERYALDGAMVDAARRVFSRLPMDERVYARLRSTPVGVPDWRPAAAVGPAGQRLFTGPAGRPFAELSLPGLFTVEGLHRGLLPRLPDALREAASESWVLGPEGAATVGDGAALEAAVLRRYAQDYAAAWKKLLGEIALAPLGTPTQAAEALNLLAAPNSPLRDLLRAVARQLDVATPPTAPPAAAAGAAAASAAAAAASKAMPAAVGRVAAAFGGPAAPEPSRVVADVVDQSFRPLRDAAGAPLDGVIAVLNEMYQQVAQVAALAPGSAPPPPMGLDAGQRLLAEAQRSPEPLARWLASLVQTSSSVRAGGAKAAMAAAAGQQLAPFCRDVELRFPFSRDPWAPDMPVGDFQRLFGPGGALDQFFDQNLRAFVDTSQRQWRPLPNGPSPVSAVDVQQFQRAAAIRNAFFPAPLPGQQAGLRFDLLPVGGTGATLDVGGVRTVVPAGSVPGRPVTLQWPSAGTITLAFDGDPTPVTLDGPWAALRLVARGALQPTTVPDRLRLKLQQGSRNAEFELRTTSIVHPFGMPELASFRCPRMAP